MQFEWDEEKNRENIRKHGLDFADAERIFSLPMSVRPDMRFDYGEHRFIGIGLLDNRVVLIAFSEPAEDTVRVISMRRAKKHERAKFEKRIKD